MVLEVESKACQTEWDWEEDVATMKLYSGRQRSSYKNATRVTSAEVAAKAAKQAMNKFGKIADGAMGSKNKSKSRAKAAQAEKRKVAQRAADALSASLVKSLRKIRGETDEGTSENIHDTRKLFGRGSVLGPPQILQILKESRLRPTSFLLNFDANLGSIASGILDHGVIPVLAPHPDNEMTVDKELLNYIRCLDKAARAIMTLNPIRMAPGAKGPSKMTSGETIDLDGPLKGPEACPFCGRDTGAPDCCVESQEFLAVAGHRLREEKTRILKKAAAAEEAEVNKKKGLAGEVDDKGIREGVIRERGDMENLSRRHRMEKMEMRTLDGERKRGADRAGRRAGRAAKFLPDGEGRRGMIDGEGRRGKFAGGQTGERSLPSKRRDGSVQGRGPSQGRVHAPRRGGRGTMSSLLYLLSSRRCLEAGWTLAPRYHPLRGGSDLGAHDQYEPAEFGIDALGQLVIRCYDNGSIFCVVFPDGSGNVLHPSGRLAVSVVAVAKRRFTYIVHEDAEEGQLVAVFQPTGHAATYFPSRNISLCLTQTGGLELDAHGVRRKKWAWLEGVNHQPATPLSIHPISQSVMPGCGVRIVAQNAISLTYAAERRSCRMNVGAQLKKLLPAGSEPEDKNQQFIAQAKARIDFLLAKMAISCQFPHSPRLDNIGLPSHVSALRLKFSVLPSDDEPNHTLAVKT